MKPKAYWQINVASAPKKRRPRLFLLLIVFVTTLGIAGPLFAQGRGNVRVVTSLDDSGPGTLRQQIAGAQAGDTISFGVNGKILLTSGELLITDNLGIDGPGVTNLAISAQGQSRIIEILHGVQVTISGLALCDGRAAGGAAGTSNSPAGGDGGNGGGIYNAGSLLITHCVISNCAAGDGGSGYTTRAYSDPDATSWVGGAAGLGGAIFNLGRLQIIASTLVSNSGGAGGDAGGAGDYGAPGTLGGSGGAIYNGDNLALNSCVLEHNTAGRGGAGYSLVYSSLSFEGGQSGGAGGNGGAICDAGQRAAFISDCRFISNTSGAGAMGSAPISPFSHPDIGGAGGAGGGGGAIWSCSSVRVSGCTFLSNQSGAGAPGGRGNIDGGAGDWVALVGLFAPQAS